RQSFSYAVPEGMTLQPGDAVFVPFGRRFLQGIVMQVVDVPAFPDPKPVDARIADRPVISQRRVELARWLADYYLAPLFSAVALMLPPGFERKPLTYIEALLGAGEAGAHTLPPRQRSVLMHLIEAGRSEAKEIEKALVTHAAPAQGTKRLTSSGVTTALSQLTQRGLVRRSYGMARPSVRAKTLRYVALTAPASKVEARIAELESTRSTRLAKALRLLLDEGPSLPASELRLRAGTTLPLLRPLAEERLIEVRDEAVERDPLAGRRYEARAASPLTREQTEASDVIDAALTRGKHDAFLLHGVTGSGKTEVYLAALERTLALGKRGIVLVPEIALTPQTVRRFAERFPGQVAVLHSGLSQGELFDQWYGINEGRYAVVIGSRSAVFAPQPDLGLIVIDEEHEWTYKQQDQTPRYHARDAAIELARLTDAVVVMGSATPDVVSYQNALWGNYRLLELKQRVRPLRDAAGATLRITTSTALPPVDVVDMREELKGGNRSIFSRSLQIGLYQAIERNEQAILFLNRRGSAGFIQCRDCGFVPQCSACAIALGYHRRYGPTGSDPSRASARAGVNGAGGEIERLLCHQCNRGRRPYDRCPMCGGTRLRPMGLGVEAVEEALHELLPGARTLRWDRDVTHGRNAHELILASFLKGEAEVLIGTQMVAKGLDLPAVTIVGVISADIGLHIPDFRSAERTFQLLTQVSGRAGRSASEDGGPPPGRVVVQTYTPDNYAVVAAAQHDYAAFFEHEVELRREEGYPPFVRLARLVYSHTNSEHGQQTAERMLQSLRRDVAQRGLPGVELIGPAPPHIPKWHGRYRWQITLRSPGPEELLRDLTLPEGWVLDIDPASLA
ncbi:MAG TPA: primosomal protein N', partial [Dehalococcoidia bacterium]|nr:primosomal protein N' [Dehalococcoidia bacterium]